MDVGGAEDLGPRSGTKSPGSLQRSPSSERRCEATGADTVLLTLPWEGPYAQEALLKASVGDMRAAVRAVVVAEV